MKTLPAWQKPIAWVIIILVAPFVGAWLVFKAARRRVWAGNFVVKELHGRR